MPRLPSRNELGGVQIQSGGGVVSGVRPLAEQAGAQLGNALAGIGAVGMAQAREMRDRKEAMQAAEAESKAAIAMIQAERELADDPDYGTLESRYRERVTKSHGEILNVVSSPERREQLQARLDLDFERGLGRIQGLARNKEVDRGRATLSDLIANNRNAALTTNDEAVRSRLIGATTDAIATAQEGGYLSAQEAVSARQKFTTDYALGAAEMLSPQETVSRLAGDTAGTIFDFIPADTKHKLVEQAKTRIKQESALLRAGLSERVQDASAAYLQGLQYDSPPSRAEFLAAYPDDGERRYEQFAKTQKLGDDIALLANASPDDRRAILERSNPVRDVVGAGFAGDSQRFGVLVRAAQSMEKELAADPAAYAIKYSDVAKQAFDGLQEAPASVAGYATAMIAEQQRLGAADIKLLPEQQARSIAAQFNSAKGEEGAALIQSLSESWGRYWPTVYKQLSKELPPAALVIGSGVDPATAELLARNANVKTDELKKGIESATVTDANREIDEAFADFQTTLAAQGGQSTYAKINDQAKRLAYTYVSQGASASEAAERVYRSLVDDKYTLVDTYRVPKAYDAGSVSDGAAAALETIDPQQFTALAPPGVSPDFVAERVGSALRRDGRWVTNEDETGLVLTLNGSVVTDAQGNRIERSFDELVADGVERRMSDRERVIQQVRERR